MRVAHFDCFSGISGDMTLAALIDVGVPSELVLAGIASLDLPIQVEVRKIRKGGFAATQVVITGPEQQKHRHLHHIEEIIAKGKLSEKQRTLAREIFRRLAQAEASVHGSSIEKVHFHEVGALDSIADIVGSAIALDLLGVERFTSSPVPTGAGMVKCAHGMMPIPAPATAELLKGVPLRASSIQAELTTPTGAAILTSIVSSYVEQPSMAIERIGYGAGQRDLAEQPNVLRIFLGSAQSATHGLEVDQVWALETNLDDVTPEVIGYCYDLLFEAGALDVYTMPIHMKKNRSGILLSVLAPAEKIDALEEILFRETQTLGIRRYAIERHKQLRKAITVETPWGPVRGKLAWSDGKPPSFKPEHDDCARIAREHGLTLRAVMANALATEGTEKTEEEKLG